MSKRLTRRDLLRRSAYLAGAAAALRVSRGPIIMAADAGSKLGVAVIAARGMGGYSLDCALRENCVAIVEVDDKRMAEAMAIAEKRGQKPKQYFDYRKMLDECHKDIDVVLIATPDHHHAPAAIRAINLGKHVFAQKPLAHNIYECYALAKAAKEKQVCTQMGNQGYCGERIRVMTEYIWSGAIGDVVESHTIFGRNFGGTGGRPPSKPVPPGLHWDEWLGPAPYRDYHDGLHPFSWRDWRDFGTGTIGDMACHDNQAAPLFMALKLLEVRKFTVECINTKGGSDEKFPQDNVVCYHIPARGNMPPCKCYCYDHGGLKPEAMKEAEKKYNRKFGEYTLFIGTKGMIGSDAQLLLEEGKERPPKPAPVIRRARAGGPIEDLYACIRASAGPLGPVSNFIDAAGPLTAFALAGHLAQFAGIGSKIEWDVEKMECTNKPEMNKYVKREYRKGWEV